MRSSSGPLCASVLLRSVSTCFLFFCFGCSVVGIAQVKLDPSLRWCLLSLGLVWYDHSLPFVGRIARTVSALFQHWISHRSCSTNVSFFCPPCYICVNCSVLVSIAALSVGSGLGRVFPFRQFLTATRFSVQAFSISLSHDGGCILLFREPFELCVSFRLRSFDTMSEPDLLCLYGVCGLMFCFLADLCRLNYHLQMVTSMWCQHFCT